MTDLVKTEETQVETTANYRRMRPRVDIVEQPTQFLLYADMPGVSADNIDVTLERNQLTIHGSSDVRSTLYQRAFTLSKRIDRDTIEANIKDGVLTLTLPKATPEVPPVKQIAVTAA